MSQIIEGVYPTRMELLKIKEKTKLAVKGHSLLKQKRDALMMEFMGLSKRAKDVTKNSIEKISEATKSYNLSKGEMGSGQVKISALNSGMNFEVDVDLMNVMGVDVPRVDYTNLPEYKIGYSLYSTSPTLDECSYNYRIALESLLELSEVEGGLRALMNETKKTKRRVNALEHKKIPQLKATKKYIQMRLDELERENYFRLKMVKKKKK